MLRIALSLLVLGICSGWAEQDDVVRQAKDLVRKLGSDAVAERDDASRALRELGPAALPALESLAKDSDSEVAARIRRVQRAIRIRQDLSPRFREAVPTAEARLVDGSDEAWTPVFLEAIRTGPEGTAKVGAADLDPLAARALRAAASGAEKIAVLEAVRNIGLRSAIPEVTALLQDRDPQARAKAAVLLGDFRVRNVAPALEALLGDGLVAVRSSALAALARAGRTESVPAVVALLENPGHRLSAIWVIGALGAKDRIPTVLKFMGEDQPVEVRRAAAEALCRLGSMDGVPFLLDQAGHKELHLDVLNALRAGEAWRKLEGEPLARDLEVAPKELAAALRRELGLTLEVEVDLPGQGSFRARGGRDSLVEALERWLRRRDPETPASVELVLEGERLRVVSGDAALASWQAWWKTQGNR